MAALSKAVPSDNHASIQSMTTTAAATIRCLLDAAFVTLSQTIARVSQEIGSMGMSRRHERKAATSSPPTHTAYSTYTSTTRTRATVALLHFAFVPKRWTFCFAFAREIRLMMSPVKTAHVAMK